MTFGSYPQVSFLSEKVKNMNGIDLSPVLSQLIELFAAVLLAASTWAVYTARKWIGDKNSQILGERLDAAIKYGISYGINYIEKEKPTANVKDSLTAYAVQYVIDRVPDTLKHFNITQDSLAKMIEARLGLVEITDTANGGAVGVAAQVSNRKLF
jgi:hypothetical protein